MMPFSADTSGRSKRTLSHALDSSYLGPSTVSVENKRELILKTHALAKSPIEKLQDESQKILRSKEVCKQTITDLEVATQIQLIDCADLKAATELDIAAIDRQIVELEVKRRKVAAECNNQLATWEDDTATRERKIEECKSDFVKFEILYQSKQKLITEAEAELYDIPAVRVPDLEFRAKVDSLPDDLNDVDQADIADHLGLVVDTDLCSLEKKTLFYLLRKLFRAKLHRNPDVAAMWKDKGMKWKEIHGQDPTILCGSAKRKILWTRITTYIQLQVTMEF